MINFSEAFSHIGTYFSKNDQLNYMIAGGSVYRAFCGQLLHQSDCDIDIFLTESAYRSVYTGDLTFIKEKTANVYPNTIGNDGVFQYFDPHCKKNLEFIITKDSNYSHAHIIKNFDLGSSRYYWSNSKQQIENYDPFPKEISILNIRNGLSFGNLFDRVAKYRNITPNKPVVFRNIP